MAILLLHHVRKGAVQAGDMDSARGASALIGKVRVGMTLTTMTEEEAAQLGIPADARRHFLRLDDGKNSYAQAGEAQWFERASIELDNGDTAPTLTPWSPPKAKALTLDDLAAVAAAVKAGAPGGVPYSPKLSGDVRSVKHALEASSIIGKAAQDAVLAALRKECGMTEGDFQRRNEHGQKRGTARGLRIGQLPAAEWTAASEPTGTSTSGSDDDQR
jgi:hypothetical protein